MRIQFQGLLAGGQPLLDPPGIRVVPPMNHRARVRDAGVSQGKIRVEQDGHVEHLHRKFQVGTRLAARVAAAPQIRVVRLRILGRLARDGFFFLRRQRDAQRLRDASRDFVLHLEDVLQFAVESVGPRGVPRARLHQLRRDAQAVIGAPQAAAQHVGGAQLLPYLRPRDGLIADRPARRRAGKLAGP